MATTIRLYRRDNTTCVSEADISKWKVFAGKLDWSTIADLPDFVVMVDYDSGARWKLIDVRAGCGDHVVSVDDGSPEQIILAEAIIPTVRLFVSCQVSRKRLGAPVSMTIQPKV